MKKTKFTTGFKDKNDGARIKQVVNVDIVDITEELGSEFLFIEVLHIDHDRTLVEQISIPIKSAKKLIKAIKKVV